MTYYIYDGSGELIATGKPEGKISKSKLLKKCMEYYFVIIPDADGNDASVSEIHSSHTGTYYLKSHIDVDEYSDSRYWKKGDWDKLKKGVKSAKLRFAELCISDDYEKFSNCFDTLEEYKEYMDSYDEDDE